MTNEQLTIIKTNILQYKKTKDSKIFSYLLENFDYLILYFITKLKRQYDYIRRVEDTDLYHTAILAMGKFLDSFPEDWRISHIPCRLRAYIVCEFKMTYSYINKEENIENFEYLDNYNTCSYINTNEIDYKLCLDDLDEDIASEVNRFYTKTSSIKEMAEEHCIKSPGMSLRLTRAIKKIREKING